MVEVEITSATLGTHKVIVDKCFERFARACFLELRGKNILYARMAGPQRRYLHRAILDAAPGVVVDHINGNSLDNRLSNLRAVTQRVNARNVRARGYRKDRNGWMAQISLSSTARPSVDSRLFSDYDWLSSVHHGKVYSRSENGKIRHMVTICGKKMPTEEQARAEYERLKEKYHNGVIGKRREQHT